MSPSRTLNLFSEIKCPPSVESKISFFTKSVFSVYLIHDNIYVRRYLISEIHNLIDDLNFISMTLSIIGIVGAIFITCVLIDKIRLLLFKILKIDKLTEKIERVVKLIINWIYTKINNLV